MMLRLLQHRLVSHSEDGGDDAGLPIWVLTLLVFAALC